MKNLLITTVLLFFLTGSFGQVSEAKVMNFAKSKYPGHAVSNISGEQLWHKGERYYWYTFTLKKKVDLPGYPGVTEVGYSSVYYWPNGAKKQEGYYQSSRYEGMPKPSKAEVQKALDEIDRPAYFGPDHKSFIDVSDISIGDDFEFVWTSEKSVHIKFGSITFLALASGNSTEKRKREISITLKREAYNKPWTARVGLAPNNIEILEKKTYGEDEWLVIKTSTYAEKFAEENAQKEWDALVPMNDIPMTSVEDLCEYAHKLFLTGSREEVKSFLFRTTPSGQFWDNSTVRINYTRRDVINRIIKEIFDTPKNYRNEYCETSVIGKRSKKGFAYANHNLTSFATYDVRPDGDKFCFVDCKIGFSGEGFGSDNETDARKYPCRGDLQLEEFKSEEAFFTIQFPAGAKKLTSKPARLTKHQYAAEYDACSYWVYCTEMDPNPNRTNSDRYQTAKNTIEQWIEHEDGVVSSETKKITINGVDGYEGTVKHYGDGNYHETIIRMVFLGGNFYEIGVQAFKLRDNEKAVLETFTCELKGSSGGSGSDNTTTSSLPKSYNEGDQVLVRVSQTDWIPGIVEKKNTDGKYQVLCPEVNKRYNQPIKNLKPNPNGKVSGNIEDIKTGGYSKKDQVLINTSAGWKPGVVTKVSSAGKYVVYCPDTDKSYNATDASLKSNPGGKAKQKKNIPGIKL